MLKFKKPYVFVILVLMVMTFGTASFAVNNLVPNHDPCITEFSSLDASAVRSAFLKTFETTLRTMVETNKLSVQDVKQGEVKKILINDESPGLRGSTLYTLQPPVQYNRNLFVFFDAKKIETSIKGSLFWKKAIETKTDLGQTSFMLSPVDETAGSHGTFHGTISDRDTSSRKVFDVPVDYWRVKEGSYAEDPTGGPLYSHLTEGPQMILAPRARTEKPVTIHGTAAWQKTTWYYVNKFNNNLGEEIYVIFTVESFSKEASNSERPRREVIKLTLTPTLPADVAAELEKQEGLASLFSNENREE